MAHVPFPKLLLRKRLWIGTVSLILVAALYFYFSFWEVIAWGGQCSPRGLCMVGVIVLSFWARCFSCTPSPSVVCADLV